MTFIVLNRKQKNREKYMCDILVKNQYGFRKNKSTKDAYPNIKRNICEVRQEYSNR